MPDNYCERVEAQWKSELSSLKRLTDMRGELLDTQGMYFDFTKIDEGIATTIRDLHVLKEAENGMTSPKLKYCPTWRH